MGVRTEGAELTLEACGKTFPDGTRALQPLDLTIRSGETVVFLGPSGCGKTTTLRIVAGLERPDPGGRVRFDGTDVTDIPIERRNVGMVFQSYALFPNMNVRENVGYGLRIRRLPARERSDRVDEVLAMMQIEALAERRVEQLSGGQRQRVALARALAVRPRVLLLDEPLTALDASLRERLRVEIDQLLRRLAITAVYVTHDQAEAMGLGDRIVVMDHGTIAQIGSPRDIYFAPATPFVATFVGIMNRIEGPVSGGVMRLPGGSLDLGRPDSAQAVAFFRPEVATVVAPEAATLVGEVESAQFLGDRLRLVLSGLAAEPVVVETTNRAQIALGSRVGLRLDPADVVSFPESGA